LCQAAFAWEATQVIRGLTQGQALQNPAGRVTSVPNFKEIPDFESRISNFKLTLRSVYVAQAAKPAKAVRPRLPANADWKSALQKNVST
jgi:hypothetical protein